MDEVRGDRPPRWARLFVGAFLGMFVVAGLFGIEAWPFTGWRLFSHVRTEDQIAWQATAVDPAGVEHPIRFAQLGPAFANFTLVMKSFDSLTARQREATCSAWSRAVAGRTVRIYRVDRHLWPRQDGRPARPPARTLLYACDGGDDAQG